MPVQSEVRKLAAIMFTDIAGYTSMARQDEALALNRVAIHKKYLEEYSARYQGTIIQFYGDSSLSIYDSVVDAVRCAISIQRLYQKHGEVPVRIGIHLGDFVIKDGTVFGDGVNIASRIQAEGSPGAILISEKVNAELKNHSDIDTTYIGTYNLKNVADPARVYAVTVSGLVVPRKKPESPKKLLGRVLRYAIPVPFLVAAFLITRHFGKQQSAMDSLREERIAVPEFKDLTESPEYTAVSKIAAHWITTELLDKVNASVVSYQSAVENAGGAYAQAGNRELSARTGAVNILEGSYFLKNTDTLEFTFNILNTKTGAYIKGLTKQRINCASSDPLVCIREIADNITGYWVSKTDKVLQPPKYDAYKDYVAARDLWFMDDERAMSLLLKSVSEDPGFIDAYFLMLDYYYNRKKWAIIDSLIGDIRIRFPELTDRQQNMLNYFDTRNKGETVEAFNYFQKEYQIDPKDLFVNTDAMVLAVGYVNAPKKALDFFYEIDPDSLNLEQCAYCQTRFIEAITAYRMLGKMSKAKPLAERLRGNAQLFGSFRVLVEYYVTANDTTSANQLLEQAPHILGKRDADRICYLYLQAGRKAQLKGDIPLRDYYARLAVRHSLDSTREMALSYALMDSLNKSLQVYQMAMAKDSSDNQIYGEMGVIYAKQKNMEKADQMIAKLASMKPKYDYGYTPYCQGRIAANLGQRDRALNYLRQALNEGQPFRSFDFTQDVDLMMLRDDPDYKKLLKRI